jgi:hypothetical protein
LPDKEKLMDARNRSAFVAGLILILLGGFFLLIRLVPNLLNTFTWPFIVIGVGIVFLVIAVVTLTPGMAVPACIIGGIGGILYWQNATGAWWTWAYAWTLIPGFVGVGVVISGLLEGRPVNGLLSGMWPIVISLVLFLVFGSFAGLMSWSQTFFGALLIAVGILIVLKPFLSGLTKRKGGDQ